MYRNYCILTKRVGTNRQSHARACFTVDRRQIGARPRERGSPKERNLWRDVARDRSTFPKGIASYGDAKRSTSRRGTEYAPSTESFRTNRTVLRSFFVVITEKIRERERGEEEGEEEEEEEEHRQVEGRGRESVMAEGSGAYKWHEWKRSFPRIMRGPRGVGFQGKC